MQKVTTSHISTGAVAPPIVGTYGPTKLHRVGIGLVLLAGAAGMIFWFITQREKSTDYSKASKEADLPMVQTVVDPQPIPFQSSSVTVRSMDPPTVLHEDIYFEVGRKGLSDDGKSALLKQAEYLKANPDWGVLILGHTDRQGSDTYNQALGLKRAETVKQYLIGQGVTESSIKVVSLGKAGALCMDASDYCRHMNRRVHLELRQIGQAHMTVPAPVVLEPIVERSDEATETVSGPLPTPTVESESQTTTMTDVGPDSLESSTQMPTP